MLLEDKKQAVLFRKFKLLTIKNKQQKKPTHKPSSSACSSRFKVFLNDDNHLLHYFFLRISELFIRSQCIRKHLMYFVKIWWKASSSTVCMGGLKFAKQGCGTHLKENFPVLSVFSLQKKKSNILKVFLRYIMHQICVLFTMYFVIKAKVVKHIFFLSHYLADCLHWLKVECFNVNVYRLCLYLINIDNTGVIKLSPLPSAYPDIMIVISFQLGERSSVDAAKFSSEGSSTSPDIPEVQPAALNFQLDRN